jgi:hypothetical protein
MITAVLMSWKRKPNMPLIVEALRSQTVPVEIWLINNNGLEDFGADRTTFHNPSPGEWARYVTAGRVETPYCMFQDDDFMLGDKWFIDDAIELHAEKCPDHIIGVAGRGLQQSRPHYHPDIVKRDGYAHILKGHFQLFRTDIVRRARIPQRPSSSDIYWSLDTGGGLPEHFVSAELSRRLLPLDHHGVGYEFRPNHFAEREAACDDWLEEARINALTSS